MAEILVIGTPNEDKKPQIQLLDSDGNAITLTDLVGYGIMVYAPDGSLIGKYGSNLEGFDDTKIEEVDGTTFEIHLEGADIPKKTGNITGRTVAKFTDIDFTAGFRTDYSKTRQTLYTIERV